VYNLGFIKDLFPFQDHLNLVGHWIQREYPGDSFPFLLHVVHGFLQMTDAVVLNAGCLSNRCLGQQTRFQMRENRLNDVVQFPEGPGGDTFTERTFAGPLEVMLKDALTFLKNTVIEERVVKHGDRAEADRFFNVPYATLEEAVSAGSENRTGMGT
jgi:hypothetical protein